MVTHETYILLTTALQQQVIPCDTSGPHQHLERLLQLCAVKPLGTGICLNPSA